MKPHNMGVYELAWTPAMISEVIPTGVQILGPRTFWPLIQKSALFCGVHIHYGHDMPSC